MKTSHRLLSFVMAVLMCVSLFPVETLAAEDATDEEETASAYVDVIDPDPEPADEITQTAGTDDETASPPENEGQGLPETEETVDTEASEPTVTPEPTDTPESTAAPGGEEPATSSDAEDRATNSDAVVTEPGDESDNEPNVIFSDTCGEGLTWTLTDDGVLTISGEGMMAACELQEPYAEKVKTVVVGSGVQNLSEGPFDLCTNLENFVVEEDHEAVSSVDGVLFSLDQTLLICYPKAREGAYVVPEGVTSILDLAFRDCVGLTEILFPDSVWSIGYRAFQGDTMLTQVTLPESVTTIWGNAFNGCSNLASITVYNASCEIMEWSGTLGVPGVTTVYGYAGSTAETWVDTYNANLDGEEALFSFVELSMDSDASEEPDAEPDAGLEYTLSEDGTLSITGEGSLPGGVISEQFQDITAVYLGAGVYDFSKSTFDGYSKLETVTVSVDSPYYAAQDGVVFNKDMTTLIFYPEGKQDETYVIPDTVTTIGDYAFEGVAYLSKITIPESVTSIGDDAFSGCTGLTQVTIPAGVTSIGIEAFSGCTALTNVDIPASVLKIGGGAFGYCFALTSVTVNNAYCQIEDLSYTLGSLERTTIYGYAGSSAQVYAEKYGYTFEKSLGEAPPLDVSGEYENWDGNLITWSLVEGVLTISGDGYAYDNPWYFYNDYITEIRVGMDIQGMGSNSYYTDCPNLTAITVEEGNEYLSSVDGVLFSKDGTTLVAYPAGKTTASYDIPETVTYIDWFAFSGCNALTQMTIPANVTSIGSWAFSGCTALTQVTISAGVTSIGDDAFYGCIALADVAISAGVTSIGNGAFFGCIALTNVDIPASVIEIGDGAFGYCTNLKSVMVNNAYCEIEYGDTTLGAWDVTTVYGYAGSTAQTYAQIYGYTFESMGDAPAPNVSGNYTDWDGNPITWSLVDGVLTIEGDGYAYHNPWYTYGSYIQKVVIGADIRDIGDTAFSECTNLTEITVEDGSAYFTSVDGVLFSENGTTLEVYPIGKMDTSYIIPEDVTAIASFAFRFNTALTQVTIPESVTNIGDEAFAACTALTQVTIPDGVTRINYLMFTGCTALESVNIPASVTYISGGAFSGCTNLKSVTVNNPYCQIVDGDTTLGAWDVTTVHGYAGSTAQAYAENYGYTFVSLGDIPAMPCGENLTWTLEDGVLTICGTGAMYDYMYDSAPWGAIREQITQVVISEGVTAIGDYAFYNCYNLQSVTIPEGVTSIGVEAFYGTSLSEVTVPASVQTMERYAFSSLQNYDEDGMQLRATITILNPACQIDYWALGYSGNAVIRGYEGSTAQAYTQQYGHTFDSLGQIDHAACGENLTWSIAYDVSLSYTWVEGDGYGYGIENLTYLATLTVSGTSAMTDFAEPTDAPWYGLSGSIKAIVLGADVTSVGTNAFDGYSTVTSLMVLNAQCDLSKLNAVAGRGMTVYGVEGSMAQTYADTHNYCFETFLVEGEQGQVHWSLDRSTGVLTISGQGAMGDYEIPWRVYFNSITSVVVEEGVTYIGAYAFGDCWNLKSVNIAATVTAIGDNAFSWCNNLTDVIMPEDVTLGDRAFYGTPWLDSLVDEEGFAIYNGVLLAYRGSAENVVIPNGVTRIDGNVFEDNRNLCSVTIPDTVTSIGSYAFAWCNALTEINIPGSVKTIGDYAFAWCTSLTSVKLGEGVESICSNAFYSCRSLETVTLPTTVTYVGTNAFGGTLWLSNLPADEDGFVVIVNVLVDYRGPGGDITIPDSVSILSSEIFAGNDTITSVVMPDSVTEVGDMAFARCTNLTSVTLSESLTYISYEAFADCSRLTSIELPEGLVTIAGYAFYGCRSLTDVVIPDSVDYVGDYAFFGCEALTSVQLPNGITDIMYGLFKNCTSLASVSLPSSVTSIQYSAFADCTSLTTLEIPDTVSRIEDDAFAGSGLTSVKLPTSVSVVGSNAFATSTLQSITLENALCSIANGVTTLGDPKVTTIYAASGSTAQRYAERYGYKFVALDTEPDEHEHVWGEWVVTKEPTYTELGEKTRTCTVCEETETTSIPKLAIEAEATLVVTPDKKIVRPGDEVTFTIAVKNDSGWGVIGLEFIVQASDCLEYVSNTIECADAFGVAAYNETYAQFDGTGDMIEATQWTVMTLTYRVKDDASEGDGAVGLDVTCMFTWDGANDYVDFERTVESQTVTIDTHEHTWELDEVLTAPTCQETGLRRFTCTQCGETKTEEIPVTGHTPEMYSSKAATCTEDGYTGDEVCTVCNETITKGKTIEATGHTWNAGTVTKSATCAADGEKTFTCTVCKETTTETVKALGHSYTATVVKPTCTAKGYTLHECSRCGSSYKDTETAMIAHTYNAGTVTRSATCAADGVKTYTCTVCKATKTETVKALSHSYTATVVKPTCTAKGYTLHECSRCGSSYKDTETAVIAHSWNAGTVTTSPTCTTDGVKTYTCTVCKTIKTETVKVLGHSYTATVVKPTCTTTGYTLHECATCHTSYKDNATAMLDHEQTLQNAKEATETQAGYTGDVVCANCKKVLTQGAVIPKLTHTHVAGAAEKVNLVPSECTVSGYYDTVVKCTKCGEEISRTRTYTPASGHTWDAGKVTTSPTCTTEGVKTYTCTVCNVTKTEVISRLKHSYETKTVEPSCTTAGYTVYTCKTCDNSYRDEYTNALGHRFKTEKVLPTCTNAGYTVYTCSECEATYKSEYVSATGVHTWGEDPAISKSNQDKDGVVTTTKTYTCKKCPTTKTEQVKEFTRKNGDSGYNMNVDIPVIPSDPTPNEPNQRKETIAGVSGDDAHNTIGQIAEDKIDKVLDEKQDNPDGVKPETAEKIKEAVDDNKTITTKVVTESIENPNDTTLEKQFDGQIGQSLNIEIQLRTDEDGLLGTIDQTPQEIGFAVELSEEAARTLGDDVFVVRMHENEEPERIEATRDGNTVYFSTDKFSDFVIMSKVQTVDMKEVDVEVSDAVYTGQAVTPKVTVTYNGDQLTENIDYTLSYKDNIAVGTATVTVTGNNTTYTGVSEKTFRIESNHTHTKVTEERNRIEPTCKSKGSYDKVTYCETCGEVFGTETVTLAITDHVAADNRIHVVMATCTQQGYTGDKVCKDCGKVMDEGVFTSKIAHSYNEGVVTKTATCTTDGTMTYTCTVCQDTKTDTIPATGHKTETQNAKAATYTEAGYTGDVVCTVCKKTITQGTTIAKLYQKGDVNGDGEITLKDVTLLFQYVNQQITKDKVKVFAAADVDGDKNVTLKDVTKLFQYVNQQITSL